MNPQHVLDAVCDTFHVAKKDLQAKTKDKHLSEIRAIYAHLCNVFGLNMTVSLYLIGRNKTAFARSMRKRYAACQDKYLEQVCAIEKRLIALMPPEPTPTHRTAHESTPNRTAHESVYTKEEERMMRLAMQEAAIWGESTRDNRRKETIIKDYSAYVMRNNSR